MKLSAIGLVFLLLSSVTNGEEGFHIIKAGGNYDTPLIRGTEFKVHQLDRVQPPRVVPGSLGKQCIVSPPSDAFILFDGNSLDQFKPSEWEIWEGSIVAGKGPLLTKEAFGDCQLHIEWKTPASPSGQPMNSGNSGIFFMQRYELQVFDSYTCRIYADGSAGAVYGQTPPLYNVCRPPGQWQTYDVLFTAPRFDGEKAVEPARITVLHNGVFVQVNTEIKGPTRHLEARTYAPHSSRLPIMFQGHGSAVEYRNIWIRDHSINNKNE